MEFKLLVIILTLVVTSIISITTAIPGVYLPLTRSDQRILSGLTDFNPSAKTVMPVALNEHYNSLTVVSQVRCVATTTINSIKQQ